MREANREITKAAVKNEIQAFMNYIQRGLTDAFLSGMQKGGKISDNPVTPYDAIESEVGRRLDRLIELISPNPSVSAVEYLKSIDAYVEEVNPEPK